jgi:hypothetical protein
MFGRKKRAAKEAAFLKELDDQLEMARTASSFETKTEAVDALMHQVSDKLINLKKKKKNRTFITQIKAKQEVGLHIEFDAVVANYKNLCKAGAVDRVLDSYGWVGLVFNEVAHKKGLNFEHPVYAPKPSASPSP